MKIFYWVLLTLVVVIILWITRYLGLLGLGIPAVVVLVVVSVIAYLMPMHSNPNEPNWGGIGIVLLVGVLMLFLGTYPPFQQLVRFHFWDTAIPGGFTSVYAGDVDAPEDVVIENSILTVNGDQPSNWLLQVRELDCSGKPHFEIVERGTSVKLAPETDQAAARWVRGNQVSGWTDAVKKP